MLTDSEKEKVQHIREDYCDFRSLDCREGTVCPFQQFTDETGYGCRNIYAHDYETVMKYINRMDFDGYFGEEETKQIKAMVNDFIKCHDKNTGLV